MLTRRVLLRRADSTSATRTTPYSSQGTTVSSQPRRWRNFAGSEIFVAGVFPLRAVREEKVGASFEDFLKEQGTYEETSERAVKRVLAFQLAEEMKAKGITKVKMAEMLDTSRSQLNRLLDPDAENVTLQSLANVARQLGRTLHLELR